MSPERKRLRNAYEAHRWWEGDEALPFRVWVRMTARGQRHEVYPGHRQDARAWCLRKWPRPSSRPPWGESLIQCPDCKAEPCDGSRLGCARRLPRARAQARARAQETGQLRRERDQAHEALREILSFALGAEVPKDAAIDPQAVLRQVRLSCGGVRG